VRSSLLQYTSYGGTNDGNRNYIDLKRVAKLAAWSKTQFVTRLEIWFQDPFPSNRAEPLDGSVGSIKISL
jgi:hypothetical protein